MARRTVNEAVMLRNNADTDRKIFLPGDQVDESWFVPEEYLVELPDAPAPAGEGDEDDDDADGDEDDESDSGGLGDDEESQLDGAFLALDLVVAETSVVEIEAAVMAVSSDHRDEAARWVLSEESVRPEPRKTLLAKMRALLQ